jgi:hypothetical protein
MRRTIALLLLLTTAVALSAAEMTYVFRRGDSYTTGGNLNFDRIGSFGKRWSGDFLWAKIDGKQYLIRDAGTLSDARQAFVHVEANQEKYHALHARMQPIEKKHRALERKHDDLSDSLSDEPERYTAAQERVLERQIREIEQQMRPLEAELRALEEQEEIFDQKEEVLEEAAEKKLREIIERAIARGAAEKL